MSFFDYLKNILIILFFLQLAPGLIESIRSQYSKFLEPQTPVGVLEINGILYESDQYSKYIDRYFKDRNIKAILLRIESPGGASGTSEAIAHEILTLKKEYPKPIIALIENICASGGYMIATACDHIIAPGSAIIGSIGTSIPYLFQLRRFLQEHKIDYVPLHAGNYKDATNPFIDLSAEEKVLLQSVLDDSYEQFVAFVAQERKLSLHDNKTWADGKLFTARQAHRLGLIDELGSAQNAITIIKEKALIEGDIEWIKPPKASGFARLFGTDDNNENSLFTSLANAFFTALENRLFTPRFQ